MIAAGGVLAVLRAVPLTAQDAGVLTGHHVPSPEYRIVHIDRPVTLDAKGTGPVWESADSIVEFHQREPHEGVLATERTVVKMVRDAARLHILVRAYDTDVKSIRSAQLRRDA